MGIRKNKKATTPPANLIPTQLTESIENLLRDAKDGILLFDEDGIIVAVNEYAAQMFAKTPKKMLQQPLSKFFKLNSYSQRRQWIKARKSVKNEQNSSEQLNWMEFINEKPILALNLVINRLIIADKPLFYARIIDRLPEKMTEWILWSLAKIIHHDNIIAIIDAILELVSEVFEADHASVSLVDTKQMVHTLSYFHKGQKKENLSYSLFNSPCEEVYDKKTILSFNKVQQKFPKDDFLNKNNLDTYWGGPLLDAENEVVGLFSLLTERKFKKTARYDALFRLFLGRINLEIERLLSQRKLQFLASIAEQDPNPIIRILPTGEVIFANTQGKNILQIWLNQYSSLPKNLLQEATKATKHKKPVRLEMEVDNTTYLFSLIWIPDFNQVNIYGTDISQLKSTQQNMMSMARFDALTQIANRQYFEEYLQQKIQDHLLEGKELALLLIDLDDFKIINDTLGHPIGDLLLKAATKRMARCLRKDDFIARLGGDEFIVVLNNSNTNSAVMVAEKMIGVLARSFQFGEYRMKITASIGISFYPRDGLILGELLKHSDVAMYQAKKEGKNSYSIYSKYFHVVQDKRIEVIRKELKQAASKNQLYVDYQPFYDMHTNKVIGIEALLRWVHPKQGLILPNEFIGIAEQTGSIHLISQWLIEQALKDFSKIHGLNKTTKLSINISLSQLNDARFLDTFCDSLTQYNISRDRIILDISERILAPHFQQLAKNLRKLHNIGLNIGLDNFGSPQVSIPKLLALPIDYIKLDQLLLLGTEKSTKHRLLLKGIIQLAKELYLTVIQKGIETEEQNEIIKSIGGQYAQGYYYCKPLKIEELEEFLKKHP
ncbi:MAG: EAL domain-containing protein [Legionella sp.]|nr:MAG: EAL domain-containing protein [Legionella sp.]